MTHPADLQVGEKPLPKQVKAAHKRLDAHAYRLEQLEKFMGLKPYEEKDLITPTSPPVLRAMTEEEKDDPRFWPLNDQGIPTKHFSIEGQGWTTADASGLPTPPEEST